jgi:hypothetical protein
MACFLARCTRDGSRKQLIIQIFPSIVPAEGSTPMPMPDQTLDEAPNKPPNKRHVQRARLLIGFARQTEGRDQAPAARSAPSVEDTDAQ